METLSLILVDERENTMSEQILNIPDAYQVLDEYTEMYESIGIFMVDEVVLDTHTMYRRFATKEDGLVLSLILCGGRATNIRLV